MATVPTVSVSLKKGSRSVVVINADDYNPTLHKIVKSATSSSSSPPPPPVEEEDNEGAVDITDMTVRQAASAIASTEEDHVLEAFEVAESSGTARKGVLSAIAKRRAALDG